ncbi:MAG: hypothetical protein PHP23_03430 [Desulfobacterales bacterium]|nr:hypothetical protein [Desulfobacterales bacterium]MDD4072204.1 hypothetical protein [Desulfobacterales bacterium]MDD4393069.1 hypothetical protein [Desulfobacterales bacterium]
MPFSLIYHPDVKKRDIPKLNADIRKRIKIAIETRLMPAPQEHGEPLRKTLKEYWKVKKVSDFTGSPAGMEKLDSICMLLIATPF